MGAPAPLAEELGAFVSRFSLADSPAGGELLERARLHLLDTIGLALVGWRAEDGLGRALFEASHEAPGQATIIGHPVAAAVPVAALVNASLATAWTYDDIDPVAVMHCEAFATAATLAVAERHRRSGAELAEAFVVAVEVALRLASAVPGSRGLYDSGFHSTSVFGCLGAAAGAAKLMRLGPEASADALALAVSFASGTAAGWTDGSGRNKTLQPGWAAHGGVLAAQLAAAGISCSHETIEGARGLYPAHSWRDGWSVGPVLEGLGGRWRLRDLRIKRFPCGSAVQAAAACAHQLFQADGVRGADVLRGRITIPSHLESVLEDMGDSLYRPPSGVAAMGSFPLVVARILLGGRYTLEHRTDAATRSVELLAVADRLQVRAGSHPASSGRDATSVEVETRRGRFAAVASSQSGPEPDLEPSAVVEKFHQNAGLVIGDEEAAAIRDAVLALGSAADLRELTGALQNASSDSSPEPSPRRMRPLAGP